MLVSQPVGLDSVGYAIKTFVSPLSPASHECLKIVVFANRPNPVYLKGDHSPTIRDCSDH